MKKIILIIAISLLAMGGIFLYIKIDSGRPKHFSVTFLNIGQGDAALIKFENGQKMLVDCGPNKKILSELGKNLPFYDRTIDYILATHPDLDHYGGCVDVLKRYYVKNIIINGRTKEYDPYWQEWKKAMYAETYSDHPLIPSFVKMGQLRPAQIITMSSPTVWTIPNTRDTLNFLSPDPSLPLAVGTDDSNNYSIVFQLTRDDKTFLFTGDMEKPLEEALVKKYCVTTTRLLSCPTLRSAILKVGHHGSNGSSSEEFLSVVRPKTAIISVGKNKYGHPAPRVLRRLERAGAEVLRTDEGGDILIK